jgi:hypothetical protein
LWITLAGLFQFENIMKVHGEKAGIWKTHIIISLLLAGSEAHKPHEPPISDNIQHQSTISSPQSHEIIAYLCKVLVTYNTLKEVFYII